MNIINGKILAKKISEYVNIKISESKTKPHLVIFQVGNLDRSDVYIKHKINACNKLNIGVTHLKFDTSCTTEELCSKIREVNNESIFTGCMIQLPVPQHMNLTEILEIISPKKDVDCCSLQNIGKLVADKPCYIPATSLGILKIINDYKIETKGKLCVIIGKSIIVGRTVQILLSNENTYAATTVLCDRYTKNLFDLVKMADILIVAAGKHNLINDPSMIKDNCIIIDVGINTVVINNKNKIRGDVNFQKLKNKAKLITPVPGGVGPVTVSCLMYNIYLSVLEQECRAKEYFDFLSFN